MELLTNVIRAAPAAPATGSSIAIWIWMGLGLAVVVIGGYVLSSRR